MVTEYTKKKRRLKSKADKLWKQVIISKWGDMCYCATKATPPHHFYPKGLYGHLRYNLDNGVPLCMGHHFAHHHRGDPAVHQNIIEKRGENWFNSLQKKARTRPPNSYQSLTYYQDVIEQLEKELST